MDYKKHYDLLVKKRRESVLPEDEYGEIHHIAPRCLGGSDEKQNLVRLTPEEHYLAHQLLVKIYPENDKLVYAANMMAVGRSNKSYGWIKRKLSSAISRSQSGEGNSQFGSFWITNGIENRKTNIEDLIPEGFRLGRISVPYLKGNLTRCKDCRIKDTYEKAKNKAEKEYEKFIESGYNTVSEYVKSGKYPYSVVSLTQKFKKYIPNYRPKTGRGNKKTDL